MPKVLLPLGRNWTPASVRIAAMLEEMGVDCFAITHYLRWARAAEVQGFKRERILYVNEGIDRRRLNDDIEESVLAELEARYGLPTLWPYVIADRHVGGMSHRELRKLMEMEFTKIERFLDEHRLDLVVLDAVDRMGLFFLYHAAIHRNIRVVVPSFARIPGRYVITDNPYDRLHPVKDLYESFKKGGLPTCARDEAAAFVSRFVETKMVPSYATYAFRRPAMSSGVKQGVRYVRDYYRLSGFKEYSSTPPQVHAWQGLRRVVGWPLARIRGRFETPQPGERYVLAPLQVHPEATLMVWAPHSLDQLNFLTTVARSIPMTHKLYVKEHVVSVGTRPPGFYKRLSSLPNVRLISPFVHPHDLIRGADMVTTINSTIGWEAMLYEKPVLTVGDVFYNDFDRILRARSPQEIATRIAEGLSIWKPDRELLLCFVAAVLGGSSPGELDPGMPEFLADDNLRSLAGSLMDELSKGDVALPSSG